MIKNITSLLLLVSFSLLSSCSKETDLGSRPIHANVKTENLILVIIDGPRFSETWGDPSHSLVPNLYEKLAPLGVVNQKFYNNGDTHTLSGHTSISRGVYETIENSGKEYPDYPSFLQHWLYHSRKAPTKAWIVGSKQKLHILGNCSAREWANSYLPSVNTEDRSDISTFSVIKEVLTEYHPNVMLINFRGPDFGAHAKSWDRYTKGIRTTDSLLFELYNLIQNDQGYRGKTTIIMTNDHGRHLNGIQNGFISHGDQCMGCRHIEFFATGPDLAINRITNRARHQVDIVPTIGYLLGFELQYSEGVVMDELFEN